MTQASAAPIGFRALEEADLERLCDWLNRPHLRRFYQKTPISLPQVRDKWRLPGGVTSPTFFDLALLQDRPFGYLQCYRIGDYPDYGADIGVADGVGIDYFIGEPDLIGQGLGARMIAAYLVQVVWPRFPGEARCWVCHDRENAASGGALRSAGFGFVREQMEQGVPSRLVVVDRP